MISRLQKILLILLALVGGTVVAQSRGARSVESVLDRLEQRLQGPKRESLDLGAKPAPKRLEVSGEPITADGLRSGRVDQISTLIKRLEEQIDSLASAVQRTKQQLVDQSSVDNFVAIELHVEDTDSSALRTLYTRLDGFEITELHEAGGLWIPSQVVPLYNGPLEPGSHRLDIEIRLSLRSKDGLPLSTNRNRMVRKVFEFEVPPGTANKRFVVTVSPPKGLDSAVRAEFVDMSNPRLALSKKVDK